VHELTGLLAVILIFSVVPLAIIMHYVTKWKSTKGLTGEEQQMIEELWEMSERMQSRLNALETILDEKSTHWRDER
jgi:phage shock protein B